MGITALTRNILHLFNTPNEVFKIPIYQRRYSWGEDQWEELWEDLISLKCNDVHFLGSLVVIAETHKPGLNNFEVVDGQQRLTTLLVLLNALRDTYSEKNEQESADYIAGFLFSSYFKEKSPKLVIGNLDRVDFESLINNKKSGMDKKGNIFKAYNFFINKLKSLKDIDLLKETLINHVELVQITTDNSRDAFRLFETLNDRGLNLSALDLIKNYILRKVSEDAGEKLEESITIWDNIIINLKDADKIVFIRQYFLATEGTKVSRGKLYEEYQEKINKAKSILAFLEELSRASEIYNDIINQETDNDELNQHLKSLKDIEATTSYTLILKLLLDNVPAKEIVEVIKLLRVFSLRISSCKWSTSDMETVYLDIVKNYKSQSDKIQFIRNLLQKNSPDDNVFKNKFEQNNFRQNDQTKYILECFEEERTNDTNEKHMCDRSKVHIEHIMPQTITTKKAKKEFGNWELYLGEEKKEHNEYVSKIGNLTLLGAKLNINCSNNPFDEKKKNYNSSIIMITKDLCDLNEWKIKGIKNRSKILAEKAVKIWSFESD